MEIRRLIPDDLSGVTLNSPLLGNTTLRNVAHEMYYSFIERVNLVYDKDDLYLEEFKRTLVSNFYVADDVMKRNFLIVKGDNYSDFYDNNKVNYSTLDFILTKDFKGFVFDKVDEELANYINKKGLLVLSSDLDDMNLDGVYLNFNLDNKTHLENKEKLLDKIKLVTLNIGTPIYKDYSLAEERYRDLVSKGEIYELNLDYTYKANTAISEDNTKSRKTKAEKEYEKFLNSKNFTEEWLEKYRRENGITSGGKNPDIKKTFKSLRDMEVILAHNARATYIKKLERETNHKFLGDTDSFDLKELEEKLGIRYNSVYLNDFYNKDVPKKIELMKALDFLDKNKTNEEVENIFKKVKLKYSDKDYFKNGYLELYHFSKKLQEKTNNELKNKPLNDTLKEEEEEEEFNYPY